MLYVLAFDLSLRYSALNLMSAAEEIIYESVVDLGSVDESWLYKIDTLRDWLWGAMAHAHHLGVQNEEIVVVIENVHPQATFAQGLRIHGMCLVELRQAGLLDEDPVYVRAREWQGHFDYKKKTKGQTSKGWAKKKAEELGYTLPDGIKGKAAIDLRDAYLIAKWGVETILPGRNGHGVRPDILREENRDFERVAGQVRSGSASAHSED